MFSIELIYLTQSNYISSVLVRYNYSQLFFWTISIMEFDGIVRISCKFKICFTRKSNP